MRPTEPAEPSSRATAQPCAGASQSTPSAAHSTSDGSVAGDGPARDASLIALASLGINTFLPLC